MATQKAHKTPAKKVAKRAPTVRPLTKHERNLHATIDLLRAQLAAATAPPVNPGPLAPAVANAFKAEQPSELVGKIRDLSNLVDETRGDFDRMSGRLAPLRLPATPSGLGEGTVGSTPAPATTPLEDELDDLRRNIRELQRRILTTNDSLVI